VRSVLRLFYYKYRDWYRYSGSFTHKNDFPDYTVQTTEWNVENKGIRTDNTDKMFYSLDEDAFDGE
jgi:hypothetical protein